MTTISYYFVFFFFFQAEDGIRDVAVTGVQTLCSSDLLGVQAELFPVWQHYPFATNRSEEITLVEAEHRQHAVVELCIRDLKDQALEHFPSGQFNANGAWTVIACLAHNLLRWTEQLGLPDTSI